MCRGYHRRQISKWQHTREQITALLNVNRDPKTPVIQPREVMQLPGDAALLSTVPDTPEDIEALWAELDQRDAALLT